jgi:thiamine biosynthesis lipoprotein ApbE
VTVAADTCTQAGMLSTLAMLEGEGAEAFLAAQGVRYWCRRDTPLQTQNGSRARARISGN